MGAKHSAEFGPGPVHTGTLRKKAGIRDRMGYVERDFLLAERSLIYFEAGHWGQKGAQPRGTLLLNFRSRFEVEAPSSSGRASTVSMKFAVSGVDEREQGNATWRLQAYDHQDMVRWAQQIRTACRPRWEKDSKACSLCTGKFDVGDRHHW